MRQPGLKIVLLMWRCNVCKIAVFTNTKKLDVKKTTEAIGTIMLRLERDGYGYAIQGTNSVFGERCIADKFRSRLNSSNVVSLPIVETRQATFGKPSAPSGPGIFHGRTSTNDKGLINCHPMSRDAWHLIHNGVVTDHGVKYHKNTTNDSEDVLHRLQLGIKDVERDLSGYYAFAAIDPLGQLHVSRDSIATLFIAWCPKIASYLICTTESLITEIAESLKIKIGPIDKVKSDVYMIFSGNEIVHLQDIEPRGYDTYHASYASASLGRIIASPFDQGAIDGDSNDYSYTPRTDTHNSHTYSRFNDSGQSDDIETEALMAELAEIDDTYVIQTYEGLYITADDYHKLDTISQMDCTIERPDGTLVDMEAYDSRESWKRVE